MFANPVFITPGRYKDKEINENHFSHSNVCQMNYCENHYFPCLGQPFLFDYWPAVFTLQVPVPGVSFVG